MMDLKDVFLWCVIAYFTIGFVWLFRKKLKLFKRVGYISNAEIYKLAKKGDREAQQLKKLTIIYIVIGVLVFLPLDIWLNLR